MSKQVKIQALNSKGEPLSKLKDFIKLYVNSTRDEAFKIDCVSEQENGLYVFDINETVDIFSRIFVRLTQDIDIKKGENKITYLKEPYFLHPKCEQINILKCMLDTSKIIAYTFTTAKGKAFIGLIKAYKANDLDKGSGGSKAYNDTIDNTLTSYKNNWQNEIYTIDTRQTVRLQAFLSKSQADKALNEELQDINLTQIKWGFKLLSSSLKTGLDNYDKINKEKDIIMLEDKKGTNIWLNLSDIKQDFKANEHIFDDRGNNIMIFAYTKKNDKPPHNLSYRQPPLPKRVKTIQCIELKILKNRFHLRLYDDNLKLLENERVMLSLFYTKEVAKFLAKYTKTQEFKPNYAYKMQINQRDEFINDFKMLTKDKKDILNHIDINSLYLEFIEKKEITIEILRKYEDLNLTMSKFRILINNDEDPRCQEHTNNTSINDSKIAQSCKSCQTLQAFAKWDNHYFLERSGPDCITPNLELRIPEGIYNLSWHKSGKYLNPQGNEYKRLLKAYAKELGIENEPHEDSKGKQRSYKPLLNLHSRILHKNRHILIHSGGVINDSRGCLLIGAKLDTDDKGNVLRISQNHTHKIASEFMAFLMQKDLKDTSTNKFKHLLTKNNNKIELSNINLVIKNEFARIERKIVAEFKNRLYIKFNGKELQIVEDEETVNVNLNKGSNSNLNLSFKINSLALNNAKNSIKEGKDYYINLNSLPLMSMPNQAYSININDKEDRLVASITNNNTKNIINAEIFLDDIFADFASILANYKAKYNLSKIRVKVGYEDELLWIAIAKNELGVLEIKGSIHNPRIIEYHSTTGKFKDDETAWCSSFVNWVITQAGIKGTNSAAARSWKDWGQKLDKPAYACIGVHIKPNGYGHVGFIVGQTENGHLVSLGGNQNDSVNYTAYSKNFFQYFVYPKEYTPCYTLPTLNSNTINKMGKTR